MSTPRRLGMERIDKARDSVDTESWQSAYDGMESVRATITVEEIEGTHFPRDDAWPMSGDDLALAKAGVISI